MTPSRYLLAALLSVPLAAQAVADIEFTEVLVDPVGPNTNAQIVELRNRGPLAADLNGWFLVTPVGAYPMPAVTVPVQGIALLHLGQAGTSTPADLFLPTVPTLSQVSSLALFDSAATTNPADLVDFVSWGGGQGAIAIAVQAGQWPSTQETVLLPLQEGCTIAHYDQFVYGQRSVPAAWYRDCTATLGARNDGGGLFVGAYGCPQLTYPPQIGSGAEDNRPWIGENWVLDVSYLPPVSTFLFVAVGTGSLGSLSLDPYGITGCFFNVQPDAVLTVFMPPLQGQIAMVLPGDPGFVGLELRLQGLVPFSGANPANMLVTRVIHAHVGSR